MMNRQNKIKNMKIYDRLAFINIECVRSNNNDFESFYDFKYKKQDIVKCRYVKNIRILTENNLDLEEFGEIVMSLKKLNTIEKHFNLEYKKPGQKLYSILR